MENDNPFFIKNIRYMQSNFVDYVKIFCKSGHGGAGSAHLHRAKYIPKGGPDGGDGSRYHSEG